MVNSSKVLTVSYGTFSCTLEGFDDTFETMKAIAEYFRDLAADDRYFGAEPPTPDADLLARIAEREIDRRVEAREGARGIVLRAADPVSDTGSMAQHPQAPLTPAAGIGEEDTPADDGREASPASRTDAAQGPAEAIDNAGTGAETSGGADDTATAATEVASTEAAPTVPADEDETVAAEAAADHPAAEEPATASDGQPEEQRDPAPATADSADEDDDADSVTARLRRIRSVVSQSQGSYETGSDYSEDEHAQDFLTRTAADLQTVLEEDEAGTEAQAAPVDDGDDALSGLTMRLEDPEEDAAPRPAPDPEPATGVDDGQQGLTEDTLSQLLADATPEDATPDDATGGDSTTQERPDDAREGPDTDRGDDAGAHAPETPVHTRVSRVRRGDLDKAAADDAGDTPVVETPDADDIPGSAEATGQENALEEAVLSAEDEAELQRELAEVEAELGTAGQQEGQTEKTDPDAAAERAAEPAADQATAGRRRTHLQDTDADSDAERLFDKADTQFEAPDSSERRNAIQHLRAAVAASRAETKAGSTLDPAADEEAAYRSDLASVVRPRRTRVTRAETTPRASRPSENRPAPLKLVAEQRVDTPREPVRPRRVTTAHVSVEPGAGTERGFGDFAEEIGARTLPELLEAAAAYMADVEGRDQFSRPMLMSKLKEAGEETFSREDGLRSFGHLLRQGKLRKLKGGRFAVTEQTEFRAKARHAG